MRASRRVVGELGVPGVKYGMDFNGYFGGPARLPLLPLTGEVKSRNRATAGGYKKLDSPQRAWQKLSALHLRKNPGCDRDHILVY